MKVKPSRSRDDDDDEDDRPTKSKKKKKAAKKGPPMGLIIGGVAAVFLVLLLGAGGIGAYFIFRKAPEQIVQADPKKDPERPRPDEPIKNPIPDPIKNPEPLKNPNPNSDQLTPEVVARVKKATVYLSVRMGDGQKAEGSGFFSVEPGLIITNAHVIGMIQAKSLPPKQIDVVLNSGEPTELTTPGTLVGVDRISDLAVVRVNVPNAPNP